MLREYAIEPSLLCSWERVRFFLDAIGISRGRILCEYPSRWKRLVIEGLNCGDVERLRIIERLRMLDSEHLFRRVGATYDGTRAWLENATLEDARKAFDAIVTNGRDEHGARIIDGCTVDDSNPLWRVDRRKRVRRTAVDLATTIAPLVARAQRIAFVDPYFRADQAPKLAVIRAMLAQVRWTGTTTVEIHAFGGNEAMPSYASWRAAAERAVPDALPPRASVTVHYWGRAAGHFHNRYVLTDIGGVQFGDGLEQGGPDEFDDLSLLERDEHREHLRRLTVTDQDMLKGPVFTVGGRGSM